MVSITNKIPTKILVLNLAMTKSIKLKMTLKFNMIVRKNKIGAKTVNNQKIPLNKKYSPAKMSNKTIIDKTKPVPPFEL